MRLETLMQPKKKILSYRTTNPFDNRGPDGSTVLSPLTNKSIMPFNNVPTIQDILNGDKKIGDVYPHAGGSWSPGEDVSKSYREEGDDYKRQVIDDGIISKMLQRDPVVPQEWEVHVKGGTRRFMSFDMARKYVRENGLSFSRIRKVPDSQLLSPVAQVNNVPAENERIITINNSLNKTLMVESLNASDGVVENGASFCVYPNYFITCAHVIRKYNKNKETTDDFYYSPNYFSDAIVGLIQDGKKYEASLVSVNPKLDIALLKCDVDVDPLEIDNNILIGSDIIAIGSPHGYENNVSTGIVSSLGRKLYFYNGAPDYMFIDLAIFPGNSGGPVIKVDNGKVVAMVTLIVSARGGYGLNAALPSSYIEDFCEKNIKDFLAKK